MSDGATLDHAATGGNAQSYFETGVPRKYLGGQIAWFGLWLGVSLIGAALHPDPSGHGTHQKLGLPPCPSVLFFDRPCPGCGLTTSWTLFIHGQFLRSFQAHALGPALYVLFTLTAIACLFGWLRYSRLNTDAPWFTRTMWACTFVFVAYGAVRMAVTPHYATPRERIISGILRSNLSH